jgi:hypothetical protein
MPGIRSAADDLVAQAVSPALNDLPIGRRRREPHRGTSGQSDREYGGQASSAQSRSNHRQEPHKQHLHILNTQGTCLITMMGNASPSTRYLVLSLTLSVVLSRSLSPSLSLSIYLSILDNLSIYLSMPPCI